MADNDQVSSTYNDSHESIKVGDLVYVDDLPARIEGVFMPNTPEAENYYCEDTGGLLVRFETLGLILEPFGTNIRVVKRP